MSTKQYTDEFRWRAVDLYESTPGASLRTIASGLGVSRHALRDWVERFGAGMTTAGVVVPRPVSGRPESQSAKIVRLEAEKARLEEERVKLETERDILRQAAKYFAGETNW